MTQQVQPLPADKHRVGTNVLTRVTGKKPINEWKKLFCVRLKSLSGCNVPTLYKQEVEGNTEASSTAQRSILSAMAEEPGVTLHAMFFSSPTGGPAAADQPVSSVTQHGGNQIFTLNWSQSIAGQGKNRKWRKCKYY